MTAPGDGQGDGQGGRLDADGVRRLADRVVAALRAHLAAVEARAGEHDAAVIAAFQDLRDALQAYDEALFDVHDEVVPYDVDVAAGPDAGAGRDEERVTVLASLVGEAVADYADTLVDAREGEVGEEDVATAERVAAGAIGAFVALVAETHGRRLEPFVPGTAAEPGPAAGA